MSDLQSELRALIASQLAVSEDSITDDTHLMNDLGADSLDIIELVMEMEERYKVESSEDDARNIKTFKDVVEFIQAKSKVLNPE